MAYKYLNDDGLKAYTKKVKEALKDLHTPIAISSENTTESKAQNVRNIADFIAKAKAAGIADVNGMAVSCIKDYDYSGVGYLYGENSICGIITYDDTAVSPTAFFVNNEGLYQKRDVIIKDLSNQVTSDMLVTGARKPIILTPETTEVDEETYQKLLSDDVDVVFIASDEYCRFTYKYRDHTGWHFCFTCFSVEGESLADTFLYGYTVSINDTAPHKVTIEPFFGDEIFTIIEDNGFINKSALSPFSQAIDLTGTDAERKARLDQFEADWKALTGIGNLSGARFIGHYLNNDGSMITGIFSYDSAAANYSTLTPDEDDKPYIISLELDGSINITPLFSHLEPVPLTATASTNKTQLDLFLSKVPNAQVMHVTYKGVYAGTLYKINESWYGVLVGESNTLAGQLSIKLQANGTIVEGTA